MTENAMSARELDGKVALVTGGSRGIGLAICHALADAGARVAVVGRDGSRATEAAVAVPGQGRRGFGGPARGRPPRIRV